MIETVIFDLDGTLLNTIEDIGHTCNIILNKYGYASLPTKTYRYYVGKGVDHLVEQLFEHYQIDPSRFDDFIEQYYRIYKTESTKQTTIYEGIEALIDDLLAALISVNVLSNKPHAQVQEILPKFFPGEPFTLTYGKHDGIDAKPNPTLLYEMIKKLDVDPLSVLYVGDTATDMKTAQNANVKSVGVLWGFRDEEELVEASASFIVSKPIEILNIIEEINQEK